MPRGVSLEIYTHCDGSVKMKSFLIFRGSEKDIESDIN